MLLRADGGKLTLKATDLDMEVIETIAAEVRAERRDHRSGPHALRHRAQAARRRGGRARSAGDRAMLALSAGRSRFTLQMLPESDFPDLTAGEMATASRSRPPT